MNLLVTGGCGFIGSNFIRFVHNARPQWKITNLDALTYSGNPENLADLDSQPWYTFTHGSINDRTLLDKLMPQADAVVHFAAESHVDRSILDSGPFIQTNIVGTQCLLDALRANDINKRFVHVSTDEVYGELPIDKPDVKFTEQTPIAPNSPYSASKAGSDLLVAAYHHTFSLDTVITRCSNNFGPYQFPEKVIPLFVTNLIEGKKVPLYGDGQNIRDWIHVDDHCEAVLAVLEKGKPGQAYNIGGNNEQSNLQLTRAILETLGKGKDMIQHVEDRLGHDRRYAIDCSKMKQELNWQPTRSAWPQALEKTVQWYTENETWWRNVKSGQYRQYYQQQYGNRTTN